MGPNSPRRKLNSIRFFTSTPNPSFSKAFFSFLLRWQRVSTMNRSFDMVKVGGGGTFGGGTEGGSRFGGEVRRPNEDGLALTRFSRLSSRRCKGHLQTANASRSLRKSAYLLFHSLGGSANGTKKREGTLRPKLRWIGARVR